MFLEECKYVVKEKKMSILLTIQKFLLIPIKILINKILMKKIFKNTNITNKKKFFLYIKMVHKYSQKHKENLRKETHEKYQNLSEKEKR